MQAFAFNTVGRLIFEPGASKALADYCLAFGAKSVMLVSDKGVVNAGLLTEVLPAFLHRDLEIRVFDQVEADPSEATVLAAIALAKSHKVDVVIGFGGGSSMDVAKLVAVFASPLCTQTLAEGYGVDAIVGERLALIQVPTTAGTGSEVTAVAIVTTGETTKAGLVSPVLLADLAVLDPVLSVGLPAEITAATGIDAMVHAIEAFTSAHKKNPISDGLAKQALDYLSANIMSAVLDGKNIEARGKMLLGAMMAGQAFANAPVAAVHALAYPLGGHFHLPHGLSNALVLPHVLRFNAPVSAELYAELAPHIMGPDYLITENNAEQSPDTVCQCLIAWLEALIQRVGLPSRLRDCGVTEASLPLLAAEAMQQQRLLVNNPRTLNEEDALMIYQQAY